MGPPEMLNLSWDGFEANARLSFRKFRDERMFFDVTVVADCGKQVEANKVVLAGGSSFLHNILKENPHPHPLIYLNGVGYKHLLYLLDFVYTGETNIDEDDLNNFLDIAHDLNVKGLTRYGTLETRSNQTTSLAASLNQEATKEPRPSPRVSHPPRPHGVTSAAPASDYDQVAAEKHGPSLTMLRQSRSQSLTSTSPASHPSQVLAQELRSPSVSQLSNVKSALPGGRVAADKTVLSPHSANSDFPQGQPTANETAPSSSRSNPHIPKSVFSQDKLVPSLGIQNLRSAISSHLNNASSQSSCEENHDNTFTVKVEAGEGEHYNVVCGANDRGEQYICHVSSRGLEENGGNINFDEDTDGIVLSAEQEQNYQVISTGKEPKEEIMESRNDKVFKKAAHVVLEDEQLSHDWYEQGEETQNMMLGWNKEDKNIMRRRVLADKTKFSQDTDFQCFLCFITFTTSSQLRRHRGSHMDENKFPSPVGSEMGSSNKQDRIDAEEEQVKSNHTGDKSYQRFLSSKNNSLRKNLNRHKMIHLNRQKMTRTQDKTYQCVQCPKSFSRLDHLKQHKMSHTGEKPHQCVECPKSFSRLDTLKLHKMTHTGEKPHQCAHCPNSFSRLDTLKQHKMTHTGEKPHQCMQCLKSFSLPYFLKRHKMTHTGEKPHQCVECLKSFSLLHNLKRHKMTHTAQ